MPLTKLQFRPGINRETTSYANEGGWFESEKIRFRFGVPEKIGGWVKNTASSFLGTCRALHSWVALDGTVRTGVGTHLKYYIKEGSDFNDITPIRATTAAGSAAVISPILQLRTAQSATTIPALEAEEAESSATNRRPPSRTALSVTMQAPRVGVSIAISLLPLSPTAFSTATRRRSVALPLRRTHHHRNSADVRSVITPRATAGAESSLTRVPRRDSTTA